MSQKKCRLCLNVDSILTHVSKNHEGLPISVLMMVICPIRITSNDKLPKFICKECLGVVITAYKLRATSCKNEQFLISCRNKQQTELITSSWRKFCELSPKSIKPITIETGENFVFDDESVEDTNNNSLPSPCNMKNSVLQHMKIEHIEGGDARIINDYPCQVASVQTKP